MIIPKKLKKGDTIAIIATSGNVNIEKIKEGVTVKGIVRETEKSNNGIFIELTPNLVGLAEYKEGIEYGQNVDVYIKRIIPDKHKVKLIIV